MMLRCRAQTWPRPTLLVNAKTRGKSVLHATFGGQTAEAIPLGSRTSMALEIDRLALTNRVMTSFTSVGNSADSPEPLLRPWPTTGYDAAMLEVEDPD